MIPPVLLELGIDLDILIACVLQIDRVIIRLVRFDPVMDVSWLNLHHRRRPHTDVEVERIEVHRIRRRVWCRHYIICECDLQAVVPALGIIRECDTEYELFFAVRFNFCGLWCYREPLLFEYVLAVWLILDQGIHRYGHVVLVRHRNGDLVTRTRRQLCMSVPRTYLKLCYVRIIRLWQLLLWRRIHRYCHQHRNFCHCYYGNASSSDQQEC